MRWGSVGCNNNLLRAGWSGIEFRLGLDFPCPSWPAQTISCTMESTDRTRGNKILFILFNNMCWLNVLVCHKCTRLIQVCNWITILLVLWLMLLYVYIKPSVILVCSCGSENMGFEVFFFWLEDVGRNLRFAQYDCCYCCCYDGRQRGNELNRGFSARRFVVFLT